MDRVVPCPPTLSCRDFKWKMVHAVIRKMKKSDYLAVDRLLKQLHKVHMTGRPELFVDMAHPCSQEFFDNLVSNKEVISILAEINHKAVGVCIVSMLNESGMIQMKTAYVDELVVDERCRRRGIGKALFQEAERRARKLGAQRIDLMVWSFNENAIKAYDAYGMTPQRHIYEKHL